MAVDPTTLGSLDVYSIASGLLGISRTSVIALFLIISIWALVWKGLALWKSARKNHLVWFIVLLIINTIGILEILYIFLFSKIGEKKKESPKKKKK